MDSEELTITVYIQGVDGLPVSDWGTDAFFACRQRGTKVKLYEDIRSVPVSKNIMLVASNDDIRFWLTELGRPVPDSLTRPDDLLEFLGRETRIMTFGEAKKLSLPIFVKPFKVAKRFTGDVVHRVEQWPFLPDDSTDTIPDDLEVLVSELVEFENEFRVYLLKGEIIGIYPYKPVIHTCFPNGSIIEAIASKIQQSPQLPKTMSFDVGITRMTNQTLLVECNDAFALGNYGLEPALYLTMLFNRWRELISD